MSTENKVVVFKPSNNALSVEIGPKVLGMLDAAAKDEEKAQKYKEQADTGKYESLALLTQAVCKAAENASKDIDLSAAWGSDRKAINTLNKNLRVCLGLSTLDAAGNEEWTKEALRFFPSARDLQSKDSAKTKKKLASQKNFATSLKRAVQTAQGIIDMQANVQFDAKAKTLQISGPNVQKEFGNETVTLDDKQTEDLKQKPSLATVRKIAEKSQGTPSGTATGTRNNTPEATTDENFGSMCNNLIATITRLEGNFSEAQVKHMNALQNAIAEALKSTES